MNKQHLILAVAALCFGYSGATLAQSSTGNAMGKQGATAGSVTPKTPEQICKGLTGTALDACMKQAADDLKRTPGSSESAASRQGGATPGSSESAASRSSTAPGQARKGADTSTGGTAGAGAGGKAKGSTY